MTIFGYANCIGGTDTQIDARILGALYTGIAGTCDWMGVCLRRDCGTATYKVTLAIYRASDLGLVAQTLERSIVLTDAYAQWYFTFAVNPVLTVQPYFLVAWSDGDPCDIYVPYFPGDAGQGKAAPTAYPDPVVYPDPVNFTQHYATKVGIWANVLLGWAGKISGVTDPAEVAGVAAADIAEVKGVA